MIKRVLISINVETSCRPHEFDLLLLRHILYTVTLNSKITQNRKFADCLLTCHVEQEKNHADFDSFRLTSSQPLLEN